MPYSLPFKGRAGVGMGMGYETKCDSTRSAYPIPTLTLPLKRRGLNTFLHLKGRESSASKASSLRTLIAGLITPLLFACTTLPPPAALHTTTGRFALSAEGIRATGAPVRESLSGRFTLSQTADTTTLDLSSPLGNTLARLQSDPSGAQLQVPESGGLRVIHNANAEALAEEVLGFALPLAGLPWWIKGQPIPERPAQLSQLQREGALITHIDQDGWGIHIDQRFDNSATPRRLTLVRPASTMSPAITLRIVLDENNVDLTPINSDHEAQEKRGRIDNDIRSDPVFRLH